MLHDGTPSNEMLILNYTKGDKLHIIGPKWYCKTTLLEKIANRKEQGVTIQDGITVGYYRQDFSTLDFDKTAYQELKYSSDSMISSLNELLRSMLLGNRTTQRKDRHVI